MVTFRTKYNRPPRKAEVFTTEELVETGSYRPVNDVISNMILAGKRLEASVQGYEFSDGEEVPEDYEDPTRTPGYDLADASRDLAAAQERLAYAKAVIDAQGKASATPGADPGVPVKAGELVDPPKGD